MTAPTQGNSFQFAVYQSAQATRPLTTKWAFLCFRRPSEAALFLWWKMNEPAALDAVYTTDEAAERLRVSRRTMIKLGRDLGACSMIGREYFFSERDLLDIWQAQRAMPTSSRGRAISVKGFLSDVRLQHSLQRLTQKKRKRRQ